MARRVRRLLGVACACLLGAYACLPKDVRPTPGSLYITLSGDEAVTTGFVTSDGWSISYSRFLISLGRTSVGDDTKDSCSNYSGGGYNRVSAIEDTMQPQKVSITYALGRCKVGFRISNPGNNPVRGAGVTPTDVSFMRTAGSDAWVKNRGVSLFVEGSAVKGGVSKHFAWSFRQRINFNECGVENAGVSAKTLDFHGNEALVSNILLKGEALFWDHTDEAKASARFAPFAQADDDGNADGEISLSELTQVPIVGLGTIDVDGGVGGLDAGEDASENDDGGNVGDGGIAPKVKTLGDYVYLVLIKGIARYHDTGTCSVSVDTSAPGIRGF